MRGLVLAGLVLAATSADAARPKRVDPNDLDQVEAFGRTLARRVGRIAVRLEKARSGEAPTRDGYAAAVGPTHVAVMSFLVEGAREVRLHGPRGKSALARPVRTDKVKRVTILRSEVPLERLGLEPAPFPKVGPKRGQTVFALVSTERPPVVVHGEVTEDGGIEEHLGFPKTSLRLALGMPLFDDRGALFGFSRTVAWDQDPHFVVPARAIQALYAPGTATASVAAKAEDDGGPTPGTWEWRVTAGEEDVEDLDLGAGP